jgi:hypothetical protein
MTLATEVIARMEPVIQGAILNFLFFMSQETFNYLTQIWVSNSHVFVFVSAWCVCVFLCLRVCVCVCLYACLYVCACVFFN